MRGCISNPIQAGAFVEPVLVAGAFVASYFALRKGFEVFVRRRFRILGGMMDRLAHAIHEAGVAAAPEQIRQDTPA